MKHMTGLIFLLAVLWWVLSGNTKTLLFLLGAGSVLFTAFLAYRMDVVDEESHPLHLSVKLIRYWAYLLVQIVISNVKMVQIILSPNPDVNPRIIRVDISQDSELGKVVLGNSVTLTPGTVTLRIEGQQMEVHALNEASAADVLKGTFDQRVPSRVEEKA